MEKGGFMRIFKLEFQKIMKNPMLWLLAVIFCLVNCLIIYNEVGNKDTSKELVIMHDIIKKTDDTNHSRQAKNRNERKQLSEAYQEYYKENIDLYDKLDMAKILKQKEEMLQYHPKGFMKKFVKDNYEHLQKRVEEIMEIQQQISWEKNQEKVGKVFKCIFDRKEGDYFVGRTEYDSPDVDNTVLVPAKDVYISFGDFANVRITSAEDYDLIGELV